MRFESETVTCESCGAEINEDDDAGYEDCNLCRACATRQYKEWQETPCKLCGKKMKDIEGAHFWNDCEEYAHEQCVSKLSDKELEEQQWCNDY